MSTLRISLDLLPGLLRAGTEIYHREAGTVIRIEADPLAAGADVRSVAIDRSADMLVFEIEDGEDRELIPRLHQYVAPIGKRLGWVDELPGDGS